MDAFATSMQASAMRFVELTTERCAVVYMKRGRVVWAKKSPGFNAWIPDGRAVAPNSTTSTEATSKRAACCPPRPGFRARSSPTTRRCTST
jgi:hypothetical protein